MSQNVTPLAASQPPPILRSLLELDQTVLDALPMGFYACDREGLLLRFNRKAVELWGRTPRLNDPLEVFCGAFGLYTLDGEVLPRESTPMAAAAREGARTDGGEVIMETPEGRRWIASVNIAPLLDSDGRPVGAVNCFRDITVEHELRMAAARDRAFLETVVATTPECIKIVARDGTLLQMNARGAALVGADDPTILPGTNIFEVIAPDDRPLWQANHLRVCDGERMSWEFDIVGLKGERRQMETHAAPIKLPTGETAQLAITRDVSDRKRDEAALRESERRNRELLQALPVAIYTTDERGRITFYNEAAVALSGRRPKLGSDEWCVTWKLYTPDGASLPHDQCPMAVSLREGRDVRGAEAIAERPDGTRVAFIPYPTVLRDGEGRVIGAVNMLVDITERKAAEERQRLLANEVNHRANNLLAVVQAMLRLTDAKDVATFKAALDGRIRALAHAHGLLARSRWTGADLQHLIGEEMAPYVGGDRPRVWTSGSPLPLEAAAAQSMAMIIHELATNAAKYGALSNNDGRVLVEWRQTDDSLVFRWTEEGGPPVAGAPKKRGVGSTVISRSAAHLQGRADWRWSPSGLQFELTAPLASVAAEG